MLFAGKILNFIDNSVVYLQYCEYFSVLAVFCKLQVSVHLTNCSKRASGLKDGFSTIWGNGCRT